MEITSLDIVLCEFYFSNLNQSKKRPVLVFKDNLPFDDFIAIPISSKIGNMTKDEILIELKNFENGSIPVKSKLILRKTFVVSKSAACATISIEHHDAALIGIAKLATVMTAQDFVQY